MVLVTTHQGRGVTFYRGQTRLTAEQALRILGDRDLEVNYTGLYKGPLVSGQSRLRAGSWTTGIGFTLEAVGLAVALAPIANLASEDRDRAQRARTTLFVGLGVMGVGAIVATVGLIVRHGAVKDANTGEAFQTIFLSPELQPQLQQALLRYNRRVAARCGLRPAPRRPQPPAPSSVTPPADAPVPPPQD